MGIAMRKKEARWKEKTVKEMTEKLLEKILHRYEIGMPPSEAEITRMCEQLADEYLPLQ